MDKIKIYLAGPISTEDSLEEANRFREEAKKKLMFWNIGTLNPLRHKKENKQYRPQEIVERDEMDIRRADAILCNYKDKSHRYIGTSMEIMYAHLHEIPVFVISDWADEHYWINYHATQVFSNLEEAAVYIKEFFDYDSF